MMKNVPKFELGDHVRVMATREMTRRGLQNKHGVVKGVSIGLTPVPTAEVELEGYTLPLTFCCCHLMKLGREAFDEKTEEKYARKDGE